MLEEIEDPSRYPPTAEFVRRLRQEAADLVMAGAAGSCGQPRHAQAGGLS
jgi:hypothetical protein